MINLVQRLIEQRADWLKYLVEELKIHAVKSDNERLVSLMYNPIESPMSDPIVQQCRGMVLDLEIPRVVAWPYNKFWNLGEGRAAAIDWSSARVLSKIDGSLMILYWLDGGWRVASSNNPTAGGPFGYRSTRTFESAFWDTFGALGYALPPRGLSDSCFMFELCGSENRVVVKHERPRLVLHGARDLVFGDEWQHRNLEGVANAYRWELVESFPITTAEQCVKTASELDPIAAEGFVVVDKNHNRIKIKSPRYVILHHLKGEATPRRAVELWKTGDVEELLGHFPEFRPIIEPVHAQLDTIVKDTYEQIQAIIAVNGWPDRKAYALLVKGLRGAHACFAVYGSSGLTLEAVSSVMRKQTTASLERMLYCE